MLGIFIGIAAVVGLISLGQGLQTAVNAQFTSLATDELTIQNSEAGFGPPGSTVVEKLDEHDIDIIKRVKGVDMVIPLLLRVVQVEYNSQINFNYIASIPEDSEIANTIYESTPYKANEGRLLKVGDGNKVVIGKDIASKDSFGKKIDVGKNINIQGKDFEVVGILKSGGSFQVNQVILILEGELKDLLGLDDETDLITAKIRESEDIKEVAKDIEKAMRKDRGLELGEEDFSVKTPLEAVSAVNDILTSVNIVVVGIAMISLIVGGIGIANTMYTSVLERKQEIGTMKAIGAKNSDVLMIFLIESGLLGLVGGIIGVLIGMGMSLGVASVANNAFGTEIIAVEINYMLLLAAISFSFLIGILSGLIPSYQASKLKPVDALRG
jgi:putative ABC transport system permease protein